MKLMSLLKRSKEENKTADSYSSEIYRCLVNCKLTEIEFELFGMSYYRGATSYKTFYKDVFMGDSKKIMGVIRDANKKSSAKCNIDFTFVRFFNTPKQFIDIPFEEFSSKKDMTIPRRNRKWWNKENLKRLINIFPKLQNLDESMIKEAKENVLKEMNLI